LLTGVGTETRTVSSSSRRRRESSANSPCAVVTAPAVDGQVGDRPGRGIQVGVDAVEDGDPVPVSVLEAEVVTAQSVLVVRAVAEEVDVLEGGAEAAGALDQRRVGAQRRAATGVDEDLQAHQTDHLRRPVHVGVVRGVVMLRAREVGAHGGEEGADEIMADPAFARRQRERVNDEVGAEAARDRRQRLGFELVQQQPLGGCRQAGRLGRAVDDLVRDPYECVDAAHMRAHARAEQAACQRERRRVGRDHGRGRVLRAPVVQGSTAHGMRPSIVFATSASSATAAGGSDGDAARERARLRRS
jgi:hypothetical protein